jgi:hypothetical protein
VKLLVVEDFEGRVGETFVVKRGAEEFPLRLHRVERRGQARPGGRQPFSLRFHGPQTPLLPQATYALEHPDFDRLDVFIVPIGQDAQRVEYEAVFG